MMRRVVGAVPAAVLAAVLLWSAAACGGQVDLDTRAADQLQRAVADVVTAAEQGRYDAAQQAVSHAREVLDQAADDGRLSVGRYRQIDEALTRADAELAAMVQASADRAAAEQAAADQAAADAAAAEHAAAEQAAAEQAAADQAAGRGSDPAGDGNAGRGHGNGKGGRGSSDG